MRTAPVNEPVELAEPVFTQEPISAGFAVPPSACRASRGGHAADAQEGRGRAAGSVPTGQVTSSLHGAKQSEVTPTDGREAQGHEGQGGACRSMASSPRIEDAANSVEHGPVSANATVWHAGHLSADSGPATDATDAAGGGPRNVGPVVVPTGGGTRI